MLPIALLGSAVYIVRPLLPPRYLLLGTHVRPSLSPFSLQGLRTWQQHLAHERFLVEAEAEIRALEAEVLELRQQQEAQEQELRSGQPTGGSVSGEGKRRSGRWPW